MKTFLSPTLPSRRRILFAALIPAALAVGIPVAFGVHNLAAATALCLLAVVVAAAVAGRTSGIAASVISFLGLNFFFTSPRHTLIVHHASDLVALFAFLIAALIVGTLLSQALDQQARSERRATEAQFLSQTTAKLISGEPFGQVLDGFARGLVPLFGLARCEISTPNGTGAASSGEETPDGPAVTIPLATQSGSFGSLTAVRPGEGREFAFSEVELLKILASQTALAIERSALDQEVQGTRLEAEASQLRAALFSSVTHDLRTPLSSIKASASGLLAEDATYSDAQRREMLRTVVEEADHLNQIVGNLLDLARIRAGALIPSKHPVFVEDLIGSVLRRRQRALEQVSVTTNIRPNLPAIDADPVQIEQVLGNLLENATRFSPRGSALQISAARWEDVVQVRVSDRGPGIPAEERTRVFDEFYRRDAGSGRGGTGLGLAIAKAVITAHGGKIWAEGAPGGGTVIVFELPVSTVAPNLRPPPAPKEDIAR